MRHLVAGNQVLGTDANGGLLSSDRLHLTRFGARWVGKNVFWNLEATRGLKPATNRMRGIVEKLAIRSLLCGLLAPLLCLTTRRPPALQQSRQSQAVS